MAKIAYSKLKCKLDESVITISVMPDVTVEVKQYLPIQEKLGLIGRVVELAHEQDANYSNPVKAEVYRDLEVVFAYSNIIFTDKQKEDTPKIYDQLKSSGIMDAIIKAIPGEEYNAICSGVWQSINSIYQYQNSALGILENIQKGYANEKFDIEALRESIKDLANTPLVKEIMPLLGLE